MNPDFMTFEKETHLKKIHQIDMRMAAEQQIEIQTLRAQLRKGRERWATELAELAELREYIRVLEFSNASLRDSSRRLFLDRKRLILNHKRLIAANAKKKAAGAKVQRKSRGT